MAPLRRACRVKVRKSRGCNSNFEICQKNPKNLISLCLALQKLPRLSYSFLSPPPTFTLSVALAKNIQTTFLALSGLSFRQNHLQNLPFPFLYTAHPFPRFDLAQCSNWNKKKSRNFSDASNGLFSNQNRRVRYGFSSSHHALAVLVGSQDRFGRLEFQFQTFGIGGSGRVFSQLCSLFCHGPRTKVLLLLVYTCWYRYCWVLKEISVAENFSRHPRSIGGGCGSVSHYVAARYVLKYYPYRLEHDGMHRFGISYRLTVERILHLVCDIQA